jgi:hypothetical protein
MTIIHDGNQRVYSFSGLDAEGNAATIDGVTAESSDPSLVTAQTNPENAGEIIVASVPGPGVGSAVVTFHVDVRAGEEVVNIDATEAIDIVAGEAVTVGITAGDEVPRT